MRCAVSYQNTQAPSTRTRVNIFTCEYFHGFKNYRVHTLPFSYRFRLSTRTRANLKTMTKRQNTLSAWVVEETSPEKPACNHGFLFNDLYFLQLQTWVNTMCEKIGRNFVFIRFLAVTNMPNSVERSSKSKKNKFDNFIWSDDVVELLLNVVLEYKTAWTMENVDWETCQTKYADILDLFRTVFVSN